MAYTQGSVTAAERNAMATGKPILLGHNILDNLAVPNPSGRNGPEWRATTPAAANLPEWTDADKTLATFPATRAMDRYTHLRTKPDASTPSQAWALMFAAQASTTAVDSIVIANHNFGDLAGTISVRAWIADTPNNPWTNNRRIALWTGITTSNRRLVSFNLGPTGPTTADFENYTSLVYVWIVIADADAANNIVPEIGEVFLGRRRQLSRKPTASAWDDKHWTSDAPNHVSHGGIRTHYVRNSGQRIFSPVWRSSGPDGVYALNDNSTLESWYTSDLNYGVRPFFFIPDPDASGYTGAPQDPTPHGPIAHYCYMEDPELSVLLEGPAERSASLRFIEQAPFVSSATET